MYINVTFNLSNTKYYCDKNICLLANIKKRKYLYSILKFECHIVFVFFYRKCHIVI